MNKLCRSIHGQKYIMKKIVIKIKSNKKSERKDEIGQSD